MAGKHWSAVAMAWLTLSYALAAEEQVAASRITAVDLFKNGLAVVTRRTTVPAPGTYRVDDSLQPVYGTVSVGSEAEVVARMSPHLTAVPDTSSADIDFQETLAGREVVVRMSDGRAPPITGRVVSPGFAGERKTWSRQYGHAYYDAWGRRPRGGEKPIRAKSHLVVDTLQGRAYIDRSSISLIQTIGVKGQVSERKPTLLLDVGKAQARPVSIRISYMAKGLSWVPSYRIDLADSKTLAVCQRAVVKNELADLEAVKVRLISGFPSVRFAHVTSPFSIETTWSQFFRELSNRRGSAYGLVAPSMGQAVRWNWVPLKGLPGLSAAPNVGGVDIHYHDLGERSLREGESLSLRVTSATAPYDRVVEWVTPDNRSSNGCYVSDTDLRRDSEKYQPSAWDSLRFNNPFPFPMTTAPAMVVSKGRFMGQQLSYWTNPGQQMILHITRALSIRTHSAEWVEAGDRETVHIGGRSYRRTVVAGHSMPATAEGGRSC